jgi:hypothetical protein
MHFLDDMTDVVPAEITVEMDDKKKIKKLNPEYATWDQMVLSYLMNSLTKEILMHVATKVTTASAWKALKELLPSQSRAKITNIRFSLTNTKKGAMTMAQYFAKMEGLADELATSGKILEDEEIVSYILNGLDSDYTPFVSSIMSRLEPISVNEHKRLVLKVNRQCSMNLTSSTCPLLTLPRGDVVEKGTTTVEVMVVEADPICLGDTSQVVVAAMVVDAMVEIRRKMKSGARFARN